MAREVWEDWIVKVMTRISNMAYNICQSMGYGNDGYMKRKVKGALLREYDRGYNAGLQMAENNKIAQKISSVKRAI